MALCSTGDPPVSEITNGLQLYNTWGADELFEGDYSVAGVGTRKNGTGIIKLKNIPPGAEVLAAYLIYNTYQANVPVAHPTVYLNGVDVTAPLPVYGVCGSTCWYNPGFEPTTYLRNRVYISDVTTEVDGNGDYAVTGPLPTSGERIGTDGDRIPGCLCSQGAILFVVWTWSFDTGPIPGTAERTRAVNMYLGARLLSNNATFGATPSYNLPFEPVQSTVDMNFFKGNSHIEVAAGDTQASIPGDSFAINQVQFAPPNNAFTKIGSSLSLRKYSVAQIYDGENSAFAKTTNDCICWFFFVVSGDKTQPKSQFQIVNCAVTCLLKKDADDAFAVFPGDTTILVYSNFVYSFCNPCKAVQYTGRFVEPNPPGMFPAAPYYIKIDKEIMTVTAKSDPDGPGPPTEPGPPDKTTWVVERGQFGTTAAFHEQGACVYMLAPPKFIRDMQAGLTPKRPPNQRNNAGRPAGGP